jgi:hypothetical protein
MNKTFADNVFIWTEAFNCGEILNPMIASYLKHNNFVLNVFGTSEDLKEVHSSSQLLKFHDLRKNKKTIKIEKKILNGYKSGHKGTAELWSYLIRTREERYFLHLDSDTIVLDDVITELIASVKMDGNSLAGSRRPYLNRPYRKSGLDGVMLDRLPDVVNTDCFIFDKKYISLKPAWNLRRKIWGKRPLSHPVVDFFDPISFEIIKKGGRVHYIDSPNQGTQSVTNNLSDFHKKRISFAAVGSGLNFFKNPHTKTSLGYRDFALASYSLYSKWLLGKNIEIPPLDNPDLIYKLKKLNQETWELDD